MKDKIQEINEEIAKLQEECNDKIEKLTEERDKLIEEFNPPYLNPYLTYKDNKNNKYLCKIMHVVFFATGEINYYVVKAIGIDNEPFYCSEFIVTPRGLDKEWKFISEVEFEELLEKGLDLIRKDIV